MRLELRHAVTIFFATVFIDFVIFLFTQGRSTYSIGGIETIAALVVPAATYLLICYLVAIVALRQLDRGPAPQQLAYNYWLPWVLVIVVVVLVVSVSGPALFSIEASSRQFVFQNNPWIPRIVLIALPVAMMAIVSARSWQRLAIFLGMVAFFSLTGSRIHVMALIVPMVMASSNRKAKLWHLVIGGVVSVFLLDYLASLREAAMQRSSDEANVVRLFSSGHYATFDIQTLLMDPNAHFALEPFYVLVAAIGPLRQVFDLQMFLSASEYFTSIVDPARYYNELSLATVGLTGESYMLAGWFGVVIVLVFVGSIALLKRFLLRVSGYNHHMEILLRAVGFLYLYLLLRADMWIFFVYLWLQLPVLFVMAVFFSRLRPRN